MRKKEHRSGMNGTSSGVGGGGTRGRPKDLGANEITVHIGGETCMAYRDNKRRPFPSTHTETILIPTPTITCIATCRVNKSLQP